MNVERDAERERHEEAIVPVRPGIRSAPAGGPRESARTRQSRGPWLAVAALVILVLVAAVVFAVLPDWVAAPNPQAGAPAPAAPVDVPEPEPALSEEELAALREQADDLLADLLNQQQRLESLSAPDWAGEDWPRYEALARDGDDAYLAERLDDAIAAYSEALELGETLISRSEAISARALAAGQAALSAGNAGLAIEQFDLVLGIDPEHAEALAGRARAERLPEVLEHVQRAVDLAEAGQLGDAADAYRAALEIDRNWPAAQRGLADVERRIAEARYESLMSRGMQALTDERYDDATAAFRDALAMRPDSSEARDGIMQAEQGAKLDQIALAEARGLAFERRERWSDAIAQYEQILETDGTLAFAREGLGRARTRADLDLKLANLIDNPNLLFRDDVLADARMLIDEARSVLQRATDEIGAQPRLEGQVARLEELVTIASTPVPVRLVSDGLTEVTLYRVGRLGVFMTHELELRPGNYTAVGSRDGYRDVRRTFTVVPGREPEPISVICVERI
jgi:tetratricopeptide (TPR) repeat protein